MISNKHKFIFIHIPKTGGTSIEKAFNQNLVGEKHRTMTQYENILDTNIDQYFLFSVIRNPWDRMVSYWNWRQGKYWAPIDGKMNIFSEWLKYVMSLNLKKESSNDFKMAISSQFSSLKNKKNKIILDLIRFENLQNDFNSVCDKIGIPQQQLPHYNKAKHKHYTEYYDDKTRQIVAEKFAKDIEYFGYEFGE